MLRRNICRVAVAGAVSLMLAGVANAADFPTSVNETGPVIIPQAAAPHASGATLKDANKIVFRHPKTGDLISVTRAIPSQSDFVGTAADQARGKAAPRFHP